MATYQYRCEHHGMHDVVTPIGTARPTRPCPVCDHDAVRVFTAPHLSLGTRRVVAAIDRAEESADKPEVVTSIPTTGARRRTPTAPPNPALQRLPRP